MSICNNPMEDKRQSTSRSLSIRPPSSSSLRMPLPLRKQWLKKLELMDSSARNGISRVGCLARLRTFSVQAARVERRLPIPLFRISLRDRQISITAHEYLNSKKEIKEIGFRRSATNAPQNSLLAIRAIQSTHPDKATQTAGTRFSENAPPPSPGPIPTPHPFP